MCGCVKSVNDERGIRQFIIVTGMSGAGKTMTLKVLEDFGFATVDSLPAELLPQLFALSSDRLWGAARASENCASSCGIRNGGVAATLDVRNVSGPDEFMKIADEIKDAVPNVRIIFLTASDEELLRRYERTRRVHPLGNPTREGIRREREMLSPVLQRADVVIDTSLMDLHQHRERLMKEFLGDAEGSISLLISSFGFKYGVPQDCNYAFDVRCLPNPYYVPELRGLSGSDEPVREYLRSFPETGEFMASCTGFLDTAIPQYLNNVKGQLHIAIGCTGGRHRSVAVAEWLYAIYGKRYDGVSIMHRDSAKSADANREAAR